MYRLVLGRFKVIAVVASTCTGGVIGTHALTDALFQNAAYIVRTSKEAKHGSSHIKKYKVPAV